MDGRKTANLRSNKLEIRSEVFLCEGTSVKGGSKAGYMNILTKIDGMLNPVFQRELEQWFGELSQIHLNACQQHQRWVYELLTNFE